jgi:hypothetical protein
VFTVGHDARLIDLSWKDERTRLIRYPSDSRKPAEFRCQSQGEGIQIECVGYAADYSKPVGKMPTRPEVAVVKRRTSVSEKSPVHSSTKGQRRFLAGSPWRSGQTNSHRAILFDPFNNSARFRFAKTAHAQPAEQLIFVQQPVHRFAGFITDVDLEAFTIVYLSPRIRSHRTTITPRALA